MSSSASATPASGLVSPVRDEIRSTCGKPPPRHPRIVLAAESKKRLDFGSAATRPLYTEPEPLNMVAEFHRAFRCPVLVKPRIPDAKRCALRVALIAEELRELKEAIAEKDLVEVADALCDIQYVLSGSVLEFGLGARFKALQDEVHRSNMSKLCASEEEAQRTVEHYLKNRGVQSGYKKMPGSKFMVRRAGDLKTLKSIKFSPPDLKRILVAEDYIAPSGKQQRFPEPACLQQTRDFHKQYECPIKKTPVIPCARICDLRVALIAEELDELKEAIAQNDLVEVADALCDIQYVLSGAVHSFGMGTKFAKMFAEVHRSNMSKLCADEDDAKATVAHYKVNKATEAYYTPMDDGSGKFLVMRSGDNKVLKSVNYSAASLKQFVETK